MISRASNPPARRRPQASLQPWDACASIFQDPRAPPLYLENSRSQSAASSLAVTSLEISLRRFPSTRAPVKAQHGTARPPSYESVEATARLQGPPLHLRPPTQAVFQAIQLPYPYRHADRRS